MGIPWEGAVKSDCGRLKQAAVGLGDEIDYRLMIIDYWVEIAALRSQ